MKASRTIALLAIIILLGLSLRLISVFNSGSFWFDESVSLEIAGKGLVESWQYLQWENNPPAHYWFLHFWSQLFGQSEISLRLSSTLFSVLNIFFIYLLGYALTKRHSIGLFAAFISALSSYYLFTSMDARMYSMLLFFFLLALYCFWRYLEANRKIFFVFYILFSILTLYTHLTGLGLLIVSNLYWFYHYFYLSDKKSGWRTWLMGQLIIVLSFLPWLYSFISHNITRLTGDAWYFHTGGSGTLLFELPRSYFFLGLQQPFLEMLALLFFGLLFLRVFINHFAWQSPSKEIKFNLDVAPAAIFAFIIFVVPLAVSFCLQIWVSKYYILGSPGIFLLLGMGFDKLPIKLLYKKIAIVSIFFLLLPYSFYIIKTQGQHQWDKIADYVEEAELPGDIIFFPAFVYDVSFNQYYKGQLPASHILTEKLGDDPLLLAVKYNWYPIINKDNLPNFFGAFKNNKRVIMIYPPVSSQIHRSDLILNQFLDSDWQLVDEKKFGGFEGSIVYIFKNPAY